MDNVSATPVTFTCSIIGSTSITPSGKTLRFFGGEYTTSDPGEIAFLDSVAKSPQTTIARRESEMVKMVDPAIEQSAQDAAANTALATTPAVEGARAGLAALIAATAAPAA